MKKYWKHLCIGLVAGLLNGLFGAGGGSVVVPAMELFLDMEEKKAHATAIAIILPLSVLSVFFYWKQGYLDFGLWKTVTLGGVLGGLVGAKCLSKIPKHWLKIIFGATIIITACKLIG